MSELVKMYIVYVGGGFIFVAIAFLSLLFIFAHQSKNKKK